MFVTIKIKFGNNSEAKYENQKISHLTTSKLLDKIYKMYDIYKSNVFLVFLIKSIYENYF
jgi:hypothetical protein